jgi:3-phenylpropionate/trans-cinnamate dioxygenase ferredoxin subunit
MRTLDVCALVDLPEGTGRIVRDGALDLGVYNLAGDLYAIEDRCSHDDGPLCEGEWDEDFCRVICPRHGSTFDLATGVPLSLPAYEPVEIYPVTVEDGVVQVEVAE